MLEFNLRNSAIQDLVGEVVGVPEVEPLDSGLDSCVYRVVIDGKDKVAKFYVERSVEEIQAYAALTNRARKIFQDTNQHRLFNYKGAEWRVNFEVASVESVLIAPNERPIIIAAFDDGLNMCDGVWDHQYEIPCFEGEPVLVERDFLDDPFMPSQEGVGSIIFPNIYGYSNLQLEKEFNELLAVQGIHIDSINVRLWMESKPNTVRAVFTDLGGDIPRIRHSLPDVLAQTEKVLAH